MKRFPSKIFTVFLSATLTVSCQPHFQPQSLQYTGYSVEQSTTDSAILSFLQPYSAKVGETMNDVLAELGSNLQKGQPDGSLGNFLADSYVVMARKKFDPSADMAFINNGGIRLNSLQAGPLRRGSIYEVMPFDNQIVILKISGVQLQQYLNHIASEGGCGIAGVTFTIREKKATDILVNEKPIDPAASYTMVNSDYTIGGGGGFVQFKELPMQKTGYLLRDATIDYCADLKAAGKPIIVSGGKRITNGN